MVGSAILRRLQGEDCEIVTADHSVLDLTDQSATRRWLERNRPEVVFLAAARVGGIFANDTYPADFITDNLAIGLNVIRSSFEIGVSKLLNLGSSCIYPRMAPQPMSEDDMLTGPLEPTNEWYAVAKIAAIKLCEAFRRQYGADFISVMPTNLYGVGDNYDSRNSHVPAALIRRFHEAKIAGSSTVTVWGTGTPRREFLAADDLADACVFVIKNYSDTGFLNVGVGRDTSIAEFARKVASIVGFEGNIEFDRSRPDGPPQKLLDVTRLTALGWRPKISLNEGLSQAYEDYLEHHWSPVSGHNQIAEGDDSSRTS